MAYAGLVKRAKSHFENCHNGPEETPVQGDCSYILTPLAAGPECKKPWTQQPLHMIPIIRDLGRLRAYYDVIVMCVWYLVSVESVIYLDKLI